MDRQEAHTSKIEIYNKAAAHMEISVKFWAKKL
jgi:hypothetical protein